jgi:hypothetical protein
MKKNLKNLLAVVLCTAGLSTCLITKADNITFSSVGLSSLENIATTPSTPAIVSANAVNVAFKGYQFNNSLDLPSVPSYSLPLNTITPNTVIPEPSSTACLLLGLGVLIGFRYLKIGSRV